MYTSALVKPFFSQLNEGKCSTLIMFRIYKNWVWNCELPLSYWKQNISILHNRGHSKIRSPRCFLCLTVSSRTSTQTWWSHSHLPQIGYGGNKSTLVAKWKESKYFWSYEQNFPQLLNDPWGETGQCSEPHGDSSPRVRQERVIQDFLHTQQHITRSSSVHLFICTICWCLL